MSDSIKKPNKSVAIIAVAVVAALAVALGVLWFAFRQQPTVGAKAIIVEVVDNKGASVQYKHNTDAEYLAEAVREIDGLSVEGEAGEYGLYIKTVNGLTADYATDGAYWSLYVNGEYGNCGIDTQPVGDGGTYTLKYETYISE